MTCQKNKWYTTVLKSETLNLFQNNSVNSLSLLFLSLQFIFSIHPYESAHDSYISSPFFAYLLQTPDNSNVFWFPYKVWVIRVDCILFTKSTNQSSWTDSGQTKLSVWHFCYWGADVSLAKRPSGEIEAWGNGCIRRLPPTLPFGSPYENISVNNNIVNLEQFNATGGKYIV